VTISN